VLQGACSMWHLCPSTPCVTSLWVVEVEMTSMHMVFVASLLYSIWSQVCCTHPGSNMMFDLQPMMPVGPMRPEYLQKPCLRPCRV
jgi:hypothetical protein